MFIGYARVSTQDQETAAQIAALEQAGCERIFQEKASGGRWDRPELHRLMEHLRKGDVLVVWKLDRLSRSLKDVLALMEKISQAGAGFQSLTEAIDTTTPAGRMMMQIVATFAEFERAMLRERTRNGLDAARARAYWRQTPKTQYTPTTGDYQFGSIWPKDRSGCGQVIQRPSRDSVPPPATWFTLIRYLKMNDEK